MPNISPKQAFEKLTSNAILIDVREADEFKNEHIVNAISIPLSQLEQGIKQLEIAEDTTIIVHCLKGKRGEMACEKMASLAINNPLLNVEGGIDQWKADGLPVLAQAQQGTKLSIFRQVQIIVGALIAISVGLGFSGVTAGFVLAGVFGLALLFAGVSGFCGMAVLLMKMPWNK